MKLLTIILLCLILWWVSKKNKEYFPNDIRPYIVAKSQKDMIYEKENGIHPYMVTSESFTETPVPKFPEYNSFEECYKDCAGFCSTPDINEVLDKPKNWSQCAGLSISETLHL